MLALEHTAALSCFKTVLNHLKPGSTLFLNANTPSETITAIQAITPNEIQINTNAQYTNIKGIKQG